MATQTLTNTLSTYNRYRFNPFADDQQPVRFSASDLGYEISDDDLNNALTAPISGNPIDQPIPQVSPDEFETAYSWFIS